MQLFGIILLDYEVLSVREMFSIYLSWVWTYKSPVQDFREGFCFDSADTVIEM